MVSRADNDAMIADEAAFAHMRRAADIADGSDPIYYELVGAGVEERRLGKRV